MNDEYVDLLAFLARYETPNLEAPEYTKAAFNLCRIGPSQNALQIIVSIVKAAQVKAPRTVIYGRNAVLYGTR